MAQTSPPMRHADKELVPRFIVRAIFGLMLATVSLVAWAQLTNQPKTGVLIEAPVVQELSFTFVGDRSGTYQMFDLDGQLVASSTDDMAGFIGVMGRSIERVRMVRNIPLDTPLRVVRRDNGHIAIIDDATGMVTELIGYGDDNVAAFARLVD